MSYVLTDLDRRSLAQWEVDDWHAYTPADVDGLEAAITAAGTTERPIQEYLEAHPGLVATVFLRGGHGRWVLHERRFGTAFRADFLAAEDSSMGVEWHLIEIEPPVTRGVYSARTGLRDRAERGVQQIREWRQYIREHRDALHKPAADWGGALPRIDERCKGWVIVGRSDDFLLEHEWMRRELAANENIDLRSWDFVLRTLRHRFRHIRQPPRTRPFNLDDFNALDFA